MVAMVSWYLWPRKIELTDDSYQIGIALYRACNQRDEQGLEKIQAMLDELRNHNRPGELAIRHLQGIVDEAKSGDWRSAMIHARSALEDQAKPAES